MQLKPKANIASRRRRDSYFLNGTTSKKNFEWKKRNYSHANFTKKFLKEIKKVEDLFVPSAYLGSLFGKSWTFVKGVVNVSPNFFALEKWTEHSSFYRSNMNKNI